MDEMLNYVDRDGIVQVRVLSLFVFDSRTLFQSLRQTYFDHNRQRFDPVVCLNVLTLFYANGRGHELPHTFAWVRKVLINRGYTAGTRYYATPECFLFCMARFLERIKGTESYPSFRSIFRHRVQESIGSEGDPLALAMRILACASAGIRDEIDLRTLLTFQQEDGGWEAGWIYKYGSSGIRIGNRGLTTALAINAVEALKDLRLTRFYHPQPPIVKRHRISMDYLGVVVPQAQSNEGTDHRIELTHSLRKRLRWSWVELLTTAIHQLFLSFVYSFFSTLRSDHRYLLTDIIPGVSLPIFSTLLVFWPLILAFICFSTSFGL